MFKKMTEPEEFEFNFTEYPKSKQLAIIEALIFAAGTAVSEERLSSFLDIDIEALRDLVFELMKRYKNESHGLVLRKMGNSYRFATKASLKEILAKFFEKPIKKPKLTQASYETLAVVAYNQPVTRSEIETVRGVNSDGPLNTLIEKGLVEQSGVLESPGRPSLFSTTKLFLELYGISDIKDLKPMDMLMYDSIQEFEQEYAAEKEDEYKRRLDAGDELGTVY